MSAALMLGIDCGGTHTDAALLAVEDGSARLLAAAKAPTRHDDLPASIAEVLGLLQKKGASLAVQRVTLGTTLEINAIIQGRADKVALALTAGPGLDPAHFGIGDLVCIVPGGLDHRGVEVSSLHTEELARQARAWPDQGARAVACVGKFSPRNPGHEEELARVVGANCHLPVTLGHKLSGRLNFPRRVATAYYNAAVAALHADFLNAVEAALGKMGVSAQMRLLKADGGAIPFAQSRREPVQSILSGPAASAMGALALWPEAAQGCSLLLDIGGTTTDMAVFLEGSPVVDRMGMAIGGRHTLVRSLASVSIGIGGDSLLTYENDVKVGPTRIGPAMAFGGAKATLLDALNTLDAAEPAMKNIDRGDLDASIAGMKQFAAASGAGEGQYENFAAAAVETALAAIIKAAYALIDGINAGPVYTLAALRAARKARPVRACVVGGPAACLRARLEGALGLPVCLSAHADVANAIGAALSRPTASLEIYADTGKGELLAPALNLRERIAGNCDPEQVKKRAVELLQTELAVAGADDAQVEVVEADLFATLDDRGRGARDMRVVAQAAPGLVAHLA